MTTASIPIYLDEAGRGPIAGPVVVGLVLGSENTDRSGYHDSKSLTAKRREELFEQIISDSSIIRASGSASAKEIDRNGIIRALRWATIRGLYRLIHKAQIVNYSINQGKQCYHKSLLQHLSLLTSHLGPLTLVIDGNHTFGLDRELGIPVQTIIKGDRDIPMISAASIIAKVTRDREMRKLSSQYPEYGFEHHVGYGTAKHYQAIRQFGLSEIHRTKWIVQL